MAHAFKTISAKPTFGTLKENLYQSDYINRKKGIISFCKASNICPRLRNDSSYYTRNSYNLGRYSLSLDKCNILPINKSNLIIGQYSKENLNNICTISEINYNVNPKPCCSELPCDPCQNNNLIVINPNDPGSTSPFYYTYQIDPLGELFGNSQCGELNYTHYIVFNPPILPLTLGIS